MALDILFLISLRFIFFRNSASKDDKFYTVELMGTAPIAVDRKVVLSPSEDDLLATIELMGTAPIATVPQVSHSRIAIGLSVDQETHSAARISRKKSKLAHRPKKGASSSLEGVKPIQNSRRSQTDGKVHHEYMKGRPLKELLSDPNVIRKLAWIIQHVSS